MSHFGFVAPAFPSHYRALEAVASLLVDRGHCVSFFHQADAAQFLRDPRIGFHALGAETHPDGSLEMALRRAASPGSPIGLKRVIGDLARTTDMLCRELPAALERAGVDTVVGDQMEAAAGLCAEALGLPYVSVACALPVNREPGIPLPVMPWAFDRGSKVENLYKTSARVYDLLMSPHRRVIEHHSRAFGLAKRGALHECLSPYAQLSQTVAAFDFPREALPPHFHHVGPLRTSAATAKALPYDFDPEQPVVFASLGTLQGQRIGLFRKIADACARQRAQVLIAHCGGLTGPQAKALGVPGRVWVTDFAPQEAILRRADAVITHAGLNTVMDAFVAQTPILALPIAFDQPGVAARVVHAGAGLKASVRLASVQGLSTRLERLLADPSFKAASGRLGGAVNEAGGAARAVEIIEAVAACEP
ncbi:glycosyltransferase [Pseudomonas sp. Marseille-QA0892]